MKLSIVIPCYNEEKTLRAIVEKILKFKDLEKEILIIDDCSTDSSKLIIDELSNTHSDIKWVYI